MSNLYRLRVELSAEKGALGRLGAALESVGGSIITIDLQDIDAHVAVDDLVVQFNSAQPTPQPVIDALSTANAGRLRYWGPTTEAIDPVLRSIRWACSIFGSGSALRDETTRVIAEICGTDHAFLFAPSESPELEIVERARTTHRPVVDSVANLPVALHANFCGAAEILAVPDAALAPDYVAIVVRPAGQSYSATEIDRISAILAVYRLTKVADRQETSSQWFSVPAIDN